MGRIASTSLRSTLNRRPGQAPSRSSISGIGSVPADPGRGHFAVVHPRDLAGAVRGPVQRAVVEGQEHTVRGGPGVGLQVRVAEPGGVLEGRPGILRLMRRSAPVRECDGEGAVQVGNGTALINVCSQHVLQYR